MADYMHFSLRLNRDVPEHNKIIKFLDEMDPSKYKSKTSFLADAALFYIQCIEDGSLEKLKDRKFRERTTDFVTRDEFESRLEGLTDSIEKKIYKEIISAYVKAPFLPMPETQNADNKGSLYQAEEGKCTSLEDNLGKYEGVMDSIMSWSSDDS